MKDNEDMNSLGTEEASAKMWSVYISQAERYDKALVTGWRADMKGILIFAGLFSATLTAFITESYQSLTPNSEDTAVLLLVQISRQLNASAESIVPSADLEFTLTTSALLCNGLFFTSLGLSLACAVIATLVEQWARDYLNKSDMRPSPIERARICSYLYSGLKHFRMHAVVDLIPLLLHMSLLLFFAGLVAFLYPVNRAMTLVAASLSAIVTLVYAALTIMPLLFANCPCRTPLSGVLWRAGQICVALWSTLRRGASGPHRRMEDIMLQRAIADSPRRMERDKRVLCWTLKSLTAEHELEAFVAAIPDAIWSWTPLTRRRSHDHLLQTLIDDPGVQLAPRISSLLLTCENSLLDGGARQHRAVLCLKALLAFAMAAETGSSRSLSFPFELSTFTYLAKTDYAPAQVYVPALRACGMWSLFCSYCLSLERLLAVTYRETNRRSVLLHGLQEVTQAWQHYLRGRGLQESGISELRDLADQIHVHLPRARWSTGLDHIHRAVQRLLGNQAFVRLDILCEFLLDSSNSEKEPYNFKETIEILHSDNLLPNVLPPSAITAFCSIVDKTRNDLVVNHVDHAIGVLLPLFDSIDDAESDRFVFDAVMKYLNNRDLIDAFARVFHDCDVAVLWVRVMRRLARRDNSDEVLTAVWRLCELFLNTRFGAWLHLVPVISLVEVASVLPVSQYTGSVAAMLRTVVHHAVENIYMPYIKESSPILSFRQLKRLRVDLLRGGSSHPPSPEEPPDIPPPTPTEPDISQLRTDWSAARVSLLIEFMDACASSAVPYNSAPTLAHIGAATPITTASAELQTQFSAALSKLMKAGDERLLQTVLECPLVSDLQWIDSPTAIRSVRRALDGAFLRTQQLPFVVDALARLPIVDHIPDRESVSS